jgi:hypothetical protein
MIAAQYKIILPSDYDMDIIKDRVRNNGHKTDGFEDLKYKFYLITEKGKNNNIQNSYSPLYFWKDSKGLNKFLFNGFYDNIIKSFGWQQVNIGIPLIDNTTQKVNEAKYIFELTREIQPQESLSNLVNEIEKAIPRIDAEYMVTYNPDMWKYNVYYFIDEPRKADGEKGIIYSILHIS